MELRPLILRSNRILASTLLDVGLISIDALEKANAILMGKVQSEEIHSVSILNILVYETEALKETDLIDYQVEQRGMGIISLQNYRVRSFELSRSNRELLRGTYTIPFDRVGDYYMLATAYALSQPAMAHWKTILELPILTYVAPMADIIHAINDLEGEISDEDKEAEKKEKGN
ncbi:MAG: hypothetical protein ACFCU4_06660 [Puniceicoccaceae bacterium]